MFAHAEFNPELVSMPVSVYDLSAIQDLGRRCACEPEAVRGFLNRFCKRHHSFEESLQALPESSRARFAGGVRARFLRRVSGCSSTLDAAWKTVFRTDDHGYVESVLMCTPHGRTSLCLSCQIGCPAECSFCASGRVPFVRGLTRDEILDQVVAGYAFCIDRGLHLRNILFMGMGEPFLVPESVFGALAVLTDARGFNLSGRQILVSTCGIPSGMRRLGEAFPEVGLAVSLHTAEQEKREQLMPIARKHSLVALRGALEDVTATLKRPVMVEYVLLDGVNDSIVDARLLGRFLRGLPVYINLLSHNPVPGSDSLLPSPKSCFDVFSDHLQEKGFKVTRRYSHGRDIAAACGQLAGACTRQAKADRGGRE